MRYYKLCYDYENDHDYVIVTSNDYHEYYNRKILQGEIVDDWNKEITFQYDIEEGNILTDYLASDMGWVIVSKKFRDVMKEITGQCVQYLDINIVNSLGREEDNRYKVANVIEHLDALDLNNSVYDYYELDDEKILSVEKYALKKDKVKGYDIFKLSDDTIPIFVSDKFKKIVEENSLIGFQFLEVKVV